MNRPATRLIIRRSDGLSFLGSDDTWVSNPEDARQFETPSKALEHCVRMQDAEIVVQLGDSPREDIAFLFPCRNHPVPESQRPQK